MFSFHLLDLSPYSSPPRLSVNNAAVERAGQTRAWRAAGNSAVLACLKSTLKLSLGSVGFAAVMLHSTDGVLQHRVGIIQPSCTERSGQRTH